MTSEEIREEYNAEVELLVDGLTKLGQLNYSADKVEVQAENLRKMFLAMAKDIRVILIKLADRLHNICLLYTSGPGVNSDNHKPSTGTSQSTTQTKPNTSVSNSSTQSTVKPNTQKKPAQNNTTQMCIRDSYYTLAKKYRVQKE